MASLIEQLQDRTEDPDETARILEVQDEDTDAILDALAPDTRRAIYQSLFAEPRTTSELAEAVDTSLQNVQYHLEPLEDAGLIEEIDTVYSEKGAEMAVYAPAADPLVFVGDKQTLPDVRRSLRPVVSGLAILGAIKRTEYDDCAGNSSGNSRDRDIRTTHPAGHGGARTGTGRLCCRAGDCGPRGLDA